jgi:hypothetical protein
MWAMIEKLRRRSWGIWSAIDPTERLLVCETHPMEDLVAVELTTLEGLVCYFVTWGRIQEPVDPEPLEQLIMTVAGHFALPGTPASAKLCESLQDAREAPFFYEALFEFAQKPIPSGSGYQKWRRRTDKLMRQGKEIYAVGPFKAA